MFLLNKKREVKEPVDAKKFYLKGDIDIDFNLSYEARKEILRTFVKVLNLHDYDLALHCYLDLLSIYDTKGLNIILDNLRIKSTGQLVKNTLEFKEFLKYKESKVISKYDVIVGFVEGMPINNHDERKEAAIYKLDYIVDDKKEGLDSVVSFGCNEDSLKKTYDEINTAIKYNDLNVLIRNVQFIWERKCYHFLFREYPELLKYISKEEKPTKLYIRKRVK